VAYGPGTARGGLLIVINHLRLLLTENGSTSISIKRDKRGETSRIAFDALSVDFLSGRHSPLGERQSKVQVYCLDILVKMFGIYIRLVVPQAFRSPNEEIVVQY